MLRIHELLEDSVYRKFFLTVPSMPKVQRLAPPWRLYVQRLDTRRWGKKDFWSYPEAVRSFAAFRKAGLIYDASVTCRPIAFLPPSKVVKIKGKFIKTSRGQQVQATKEIFWRWAPLLDPGDMEHHWCPYCRRPTIFTWFSTHHAITGTHRSLMDPTARRCTICGIRLEGIGAWARKGC